MSATAPDMVTRPGLTALTLLVTASMLAGCLGSTTDPIDPAAPEPVLETAGLTSYIHDLTPLDEAMKVVEQIQEHVRVVTPDGQELDTWLVRPQTDEPVPIVLEVTPYYSGGPLIRTDTTDRDRDGDRTERYHVLGLRGEELVRRGYAVGISSVRGTGTSGGCFTQGGPQEAHDTATVIEELAAQPWSNGNVGLIGVSYPGTTPQDVWIEAPSALKTIVPISGISDFYKYNFVHGVPIVVQGFAFNTYYWLLEGPVPNGFGPQNLDDLASIPHATAGEACTDQLDVQEGGITSTLDGNKDEYWQLRDFSRELRDSWDRNDERASVFFIHGLNDWNVKPHMMEEWLDLVQDSGVPYKVWLGQWTHNWPQREDWWNTTVPAWFDSQLKGIDNGILDAPAVQVQSDDGVWRHEERWPPADTRPVVLHLHPGGDLDATAPGSGRAGYDDRHGMLRPSTMTGQDAPDRITFRSAPVEEDLTVSGMPRFVGTVTASGERASLMITLAHESPDGELYSINYAAQSLNHVEDLANGKTSIAGIAQEVDVGFFPQDDVIPKGHRIVLTFAGNLVRNGPGPSLQPVSTGSTIALDLSSARLVLPTDESRVVEEPQPCWEGWELDDDGEPIPGTCYWYQ